MALHDIVYRWEQWREVFGSPSSRQRKKLGERLRNQPALLYWGDSWFMTPLYLNLAAQSMSRIDGVAMVIGKPGATAENLFSKRSIRAIVQRLLNNPFDVLCISAGGNDGLSERLDQVFGKQWNGPKLSAGAAFKRLEQAGVFKNLLQHYSALLTALAPVKKQRPTFRVLGHGYAPLLRIGVAGDLSKANIGLIAVLKRNVGPWLWGPMQRVLASKQDGKAFADQMMLDGFRGQVLEPLAKKFPDLFDFVDFEQVVAVGKPSFWYDEIHPTEKGFAELAPVFNAGVRAALPAQKRNAVR